MMTEVIKQVPLALNPIQGEGVLIKKIAKSEPSNQNKDKKASLEMASKVAQELNKQMEPSHKVRFHVRDFNKTSGDNIVIQIVDGEGKVITEIPSEKIRQVAEDMAAKISGDQAVGMIVDHVAA